MQKGIQVSRKLSGRCSSLRRGRAGATDVDLTSNRPGEMALLSSSAQGLDERDAAMFEGRAAQVDLISLLSTGEARGANSRQTRYCECVGFV